MTDTTADRQGVPLRATDVRRHLVLVNQRGWQAMEDLVRIATKVRWLDPSIGVFIARAEVEDEALHEAAAQNPSLVFSFGPLGRFKPKRGKIYQGRIIPKFEQLRRLHAAGVPVPRTAYLTPQTDLSPAIWGDLVILKPSDIGSSSHGAGIQLMRTERVRYRAPEEYPEDHPARKGPMIIQQFIDTGDHIESFRVLTLFGEPLYCSRSRAASPRIRLDATDEEIEKAMIHIQGLAFEERRRTYVYDADVLMAARSAHGAIPEAALQGCDVLRDHRSGRVYILELNPGGNTWHFSSDYFAETRGRDPDEMNRMRYSQFDAMNTAAHVLVERCRAEAV